MLVAPVLLLALASAPHPALCDPMWLPISRDANAVPMVVHPLADTIADVRSPRFSASGPIEALEASLRGERGPQRLRYGQSALMVDPGSTLGVARGVRVVLVPWQFVEDCSPAPWLETALWAPVDTVSFLTAWLRPRAGWIGDAPTFDVEVRGWQPTWRVGETRWNQSREGLLTPTEFLALYEGLPTHSELHSAPLLRARVAALRRRHPAIVDREPARTMLGNLERYAASLPR
ncbi:MAG: hypothetical protein H7066_17060 [Cytophagaceae bacterium]|nr:hypothetical protein [Gemmatimonadaceae bacterium]